MGVYVYTVLVDGFGFAPNATVVTVPVGADADSYGWALGSMLFDANRLSWVYVFA